MTTLDHRPAELDPATRAAAPTLDVVVPVYNEREAVRSSVLRLHRYLTAMVPMSWRITIADNASTDDTLAIARALAGELPNVRVLHVSEKGRGRALLAAWTGNDAEVLAYMDVDLSTDLAGPLPLVAPLVSGHSDVAIGTRLARGSRVVRGHKREVISRIYNAILHATLGSRFSDAQCGFKAIRRDRAAQLLPRIKDGGWFFDTELLVLAERSGLRIHEVPVDWIDDPDSHVDLVATAIGDLRGVARLSRPLLGQAFRFAVIGVVSTLAYVGLYLGLRHPLGAIAANTVALGVTAVANTAANRRLTFRVCGRAGAMRHQLQGLTVFGIALAVTTLSLAALHSRVAAPSRGLELAVLVIANLMATAGRFVAMRSWVFRGAT
jgi:glycosyltransferase involved in cell wall biosynthesis